ncbi:MAG TPA: Holliday junction ATP-dependent DNA helicase RuvA [Candidatus Omnitrophota bacterium]|nr:Holliday junction ATP-dependent DNA helicase RuvA [Candidatus Omnitrophota bacterium]HRZ15071.1 Holliday junction ATP-dependent DNA helicase RuvA [Candidatus Omnitrophota bacterium]
MIARIGGKIVEQRQNYLLIENSGLTYQVLLPASSMQRLPDHIRPDGTIELVTFHYYQVEPSRSFPVLIGFLNDIEKEFFEAFITVSGIGPRAAVRALNQPISQIAKAIDEGDAAFLRSLPGIGQQRAKEIIAKLQNKVGKFGLMRDTRAGALPSAPDYTDEALAVLMQLGYKKNEAAAMMKKAQELNPAITSTEELLNEVYKQRKTI